MARTSGAEVRRLDLVLAGHRRPGVHRWLSRAHPAAVRRELGSAGWACHLLPGARVWDSASLFEATAQVLGTPGRFDRSWSALADCLADLSWLPAHGHVLVWDRYGLLARHEPESWPRARAVLDGAVRDRIVSGAPPLYVLLRGAGPTEHLPLL